MILLIPYILIILSILSKNENFYMYIMRERGKTPKGISKNQQKMKI